MDTNETRWDRRLKIKTTGRDDTGSDYYRFPYEPTPYSVLERLAESGLIGESNVLIDYGCGKGRVDFFIARRCNCQTIGIEYNEYIYRQAAGNKQTAVSSSKVSVICENAERFDVPTDADRFYFFNPFSVQILQKVLARILDSWYAVPREILLFFYYPSDDYIGYLMQRRELSYAGEIDCRDLFDGENGRERILIYRI